MGVAIWYGQQHIAMILADPGFHQCLPVGATSRNDPCIVGYAGNYRQGQPIAMILAWWGTPGSTIRTTNRNDPCMVGYTRDYRQGQLIAMICTMGIPGSTVRDNQSQRPLFGGVGQGLRAGTANRNDSHRV